MLENLSDYLSLGVMFFTVGLCFYIIYAISDRNHAKKVKMREELYLSFIEDAEDDYDDSQSEEQDEY